MRNLLIVLVMGITALLFYSALWFKSDSIEEDITARTTDALTSAGAKNIEIDVDGRHVTLSGVVYDTVTEESYLDTADATYGALGPIDGLTVQADGGYVSAIKTNDGISLRGTVPNAETRAALIAQAQSATDGGVDDQLVVAGPEASWQDEAAFGVSQLGALTAGTVTVAAGSYVLSGSTDNDPALVADTVTTRDGWNAFISSPIEEQGLSAEVSRLSAEVMAGKDRIGELEENTDAVRAELGSANTIIGEKDQTIADLTDQLADGNAQIATLQTELENRQATLGSTDERIIALTGDLDAANGTISDLSTQLEARDQTIADLTSQVADRDSIDVELSNLKASLNEGEANTAGLRSQLTAANATIGEKDQTIADLTRQVADRDITIGGLTDKVAELTAGADQTVADLTGELAARDGTISKLTATISEKDQQIANLSAAVADRNAAIVDLNAKVSDLDGSVVSAAALEGQIAELTEVVADRDQTIAALQTRRLPTANLAEQCAAQATGVLAGSKINFRTASAQIAGDSVELLERLTGIALACVGDGLSVEIGGHTDAQGSTADNQALSEARAQAVRAFMNERGVPVDGLRAIGFGESQPIASNDTAEGRAQNRRISFDWQAR